MLQLLDDGRLTDGKGRVVDFTNTVIVMTSNLRDQDSLRAHFRPEFINRLDEIVWFHPLEKEHIKQIVEIQLRGLLKRLSDRKITVVLSERAKDFLVREGYDPVYGARPLKRALQRKLLDPLALRVLEGAFREGDTVAVDVADDELSFVKGHAVHA
jgi:ATP-dependent Clp protease ATP-binding subunit ClpB